MNKLISTQAIDAKKSKLTYLTGLLLIIFMMIGLMPLHASESDSKSDATKLLYKNDSTYVYDWNTTVTVRYSGTRLDNSSSTKKTELVTQENKTILHALARVTAISTTTEGNTLMGLIVEKPTFTGFDKEGVEMSEVDEDFINELKVPIYYVQAPTGKIINIMAIPTKELSALNIKRGIISALQTTLSNDSTGSVRNITEEDVNGAYTAQLSSIVDGNTIVITKTRDQNAFTRFPGNADISLSKDFVINDSMTTRFSSQQSIVESVSLSGSYLSGGNRNQSVPAEGVGMWSDATYKSELKLVGIESITDKFPMDGYESMSLTADHIEIADDPSEVEDSLSQLSGDPSNSISYNNFAKALIENPDELKQIKEKMSNGTINLSMYPAIIGALSVLGTPEAQEILVNDIIRKESIPTDIKGQGIVGLGLVKNPSSESVDFLETLSNQKSDILSSQATLLLGAVAEKLAITDPARASRIVKNFESLLTEARDNEEIDLYLGALGNAGNDTSVDIMGAYLFNSSPIIRQSAVEAFRKMTSPHAFDYLRQVLSSEIESNIRAAAEKILISKQLMPEELSLPESNYDWTYQLNIGGSDVYGQILAELHANNNNGNSNFYILGQGEIKAYAWSFNKSIARAYACSEVVNQNGTLRRKFSAKAYVLGNQVVSYERFLNCGQTVSGVLWSGSMTFFNMSVNFYPMGICVSLGVKVGGSASLNYGYGFNSCNAPIQAKAYASITPSGCITASGSASVSIYILKVGVTISANILNTSFPVTLTATAQTINPYLCAQFLITKVQQSINGNLKLWAKRRKFILFGGWKTIFSTILWSFSSSSNTSTVFNYLWCL